MRPCEAPAREASIRFVVLDLMRWVLAMLVAAEHLGGFAAPHKAYLAVDFFFVLSGFVLTGAYIQKASEPGFIRTFVVDRVARLYPLHLVTLLALVAVNVLFWATTQHALESGWSYGDGHAYTFVLNLLMLQNVGLTTDTSWNAPSWSISVEFVVNIGLGLALVHIARRHLWPWLVVTAVLSFVVLFNSFGHLGMFTEPAFGFVNSGLLRGIGGIALGVLAWLIFERFRDHPWGRFAKWGAGASALAFLALILLDPEVRNLDFLAVPAMFFAVLLTAVAEYRRPVPAGWMLTYV